MKSRFVYMVTRPDTHGGVSMPAASPEEAARRALRYRTMDGARSIEVRSFAGGPVGRWTYAVEDLRK